MKRFGLLRFGNVNPFLIEYLQYSLTQEFSKIFNLVEIIEKRIEIPKEAYNKKRNQYKSAFFLTITRISALQLNYNKILGITDVDIYAPDLNFIFGQAEYSELGEDSKAGIISVARLHPEFYGIVGQKDELPVIYLKRTLKEALHEIGHTLGLNHCQNLCVMKFSNCIEDIDEKIENFCNECAEKINIK